MLFKQTLFPALAVVTGVGLAATSCVEHDYDLADDIDLTVQVGGDLTLPASNTDVLTLSEILDLDPTSSIKEVGVTTDGETYGLNNGDYVLVQGGESEPSNFTVDPVDLKGLGNTARTVLPEFVGVGISEVTVQSDPTVNIINLHDDNVSHEIVRLDNATMDVGISFAISYESSNFNGTLTLNEGYTAEFDPNWTIRIADAATAEFVELVNNYTLRFRKDYNITRNHPMVANIKLVKVDFSLYSDMGITSPGHFDLENDVHSHGDITIGAGQLALGQKAQVTMVTTTSVDERGKIKTVTGIVNPEINIEDTPFSINDIPDFLMDDENSLDIENPRILFSVNNNSPLTIHVSGLLDAYKNGTSTISAPVEIGMAQPINVPPMGTTDIVICCHDEPENPWFNGKSIVVVPNLNELLKTIPDEIKFYNVEAKAEQSPVTFELEHTYTFDANYNAVIPLAFGAGMRLHYTHETNDWDEDLEDYNFNEVNITATIVNSLPLTMTPAVEALDANHNVISNITATITNMDGTPVQIQPGTPGNTTDTPVKIVLRSTATNMKALTGVRILFDGYNPTVGMNLNSAQSLRFNDIQIKIIGGVTINLND